MIVETRNGKTFASDRGLAMTQVADVSFEERRYIMERMRSADKSAEDDMSEWREATPEEVEEWKRIQREKYKELNESI